MATTGITGTVDRTAASRVTSGSDEALKSALQLN